MLLLPIWIILLLIVGSHTGVAWVSSDDSTCRRTFLSSIPSVVLLASTTCQAAPPVNAGEAIRQSAANIPGYGQPDVYYPLAFKGTWKMHRQVVVGDTETIEIEYPVRFITSLQEDAVVADRGYNQANLEEAISDDAVQNCEWKETNPNDLRLIFATGRSKEIKVTKRSTERTDTTVSSSEFQRVVTQEGSSSIPEITARRVLSKWKVNDNGVWQGLEIVYDVGGGGDPLSMTIAATPQQPKILSKSRLTLSRE